jgi:hypothetical protein
MHKLPAVSLEHHDRLHAIVDRLGRLGDCSNGDCLDTSRLREARPVIEEIHEGLTTLLIPHMEAVETAVYPTLERILADRESLDLMRREHEEIRRLAGVVGHFVEHPDAPVNRGTVLLMRRALLRLYATLKAHLIEEELYVPILEGSLTDDQAAELAHALDHAAVATL